MAKQVCLRVGTYNILHGADYPKRCATGVDEVDLSLCADSIASMSLDICGLNEVRNQENVEGLCHQSREIAERLSYEQVFAPAIDFRGGKYGNALLSRFSLKSLACHPIAVEKEARVGKRHYEDRVVLDALLSIEGETLRVLVTHFGLNRDEIELAVKTVSALVENSPYPTVLMGDFNVTPDDAVLSPIRALMTDTASVSDEPLYTFLSDKPDRKIDYIFVSRGIEVLSVSAPDIKTSDHRPLIATLSITF